MTGVSKALPVGRELDALVAEMVMGVNPWRTGYEVGSGGPVETHNTSPRYSTDIGAAWSVVDALRAKGFDVTVYSEGFGGWGAHVFERFFIRASAESHKPNTAPLVICLAALRAIEAHVGSDAGAAPAKDAGMGDTPERTRPRPASSADSRERDS